MPIADKKYASVAEETKRRRLFAENLLFIERHNREAELSLKTFFLSINKFADLVCCLMMKCEINVYSTITTIAKHCLHLRHMQLLSH